MQVNKVIILVGPTASGKTEVSLELAKRFKNAEIISADPMLVYKGFDIGTAKPSKEYLSSIKHHFVDILEPDEIFSAADFARDAKKIINKLLDNGKIPIVVSGTGFYIRILMNGIFHAPESDWNLRKKLEEEAKLNGKEVLHKKLFDIDPATAIKLHKNDSRRIIRAIEIYELTGKPISFWKKIKPETNKFDFVVFGIRRNRTDLYKRVDKRVDDMIKNGFLEEVRVLLSKYGKDVPAFKGLGYKGLAEFLTKDTDYSLEKIIEKIKINTRRYVKRQITWFKKEACINWIDVYENSTSKEITDKIIKLLRQNKLQKLKQ